MPPMQILPGHQEYPSSPARARVRATILQHEPVDALRNDVQHVVAARPPQASGGHEHLVEISVLKAAEAPVKIQHSLVQFQIDRERTTCTVRRCTQRDHSVLLERAYNPASRKRLRTSSSALSESGPPTKSDSRWTSSSSAVHVRNAEIGWQPLPRFRARLCSARSAAGVRRARRSANGSRTVCAVAGGAESATKAIRKAASKRTMAERVPLTSTPSPQPRPARRVHRHDRRRRTAPRVRGNASAALVFPALFGFIPRRSFTGRGVARTLRRSPRGSP